MRDAMFWVLDGACIEGVLGFVSNFGFMAMIRSEGLGCTYIHA